MFAGIFSVCENGECNFTYLRKDEKIAWLHGRIVIGLGFTILSTKMGDRKRRSKRVREIKEKSSRGIKCHVQTRV